MDNVSQAARSTTLVDALSLRRTEDFYRWEHRGRGWQVWHHPVGIEPSFEPFHYRSRDFPQEDDSRRHTFLSRSIKVLREGFVTRVQTEVERDEIEDLSILPAQPTDKSSITEIGIAMPPDERITSDQAEQFLLSLSLCHYPVSFEVIGGNGLILFQISCRERDISAVEGSLASFFPSAALRKQSSNVLDRLTPEDTLVVDFGLSEEFMRPLRPAISADPDPLIGLVGALESLQTGEMGLLQVLFQGTRFPWTESILRAVSDGAGGSFFADAPEMPELARQKTRLPLFAAVVRIVASSKVSQRRWDIVRYLASGLVQFTDPHSNELIPLSNDEYDHRDHVEDVLSRRTRRSGMILNSKELASLIHPPSSSVRSLGVLRHFKKSQPAPRTVQHHDYILGENVYRGVSSTVSLDMRQRLNHIHIIGATGTGKSTLLHSLIVQDIERGHGVAVIDAHGDLIEKVLGYLPRKRLKDVVLFDPADTENHHGINILSVRDESEKNVAASDLVAAFRRISTSWGDQMTVVLGNAIQAFLESPRTGTLIDLKKFLIDSGFRKEFLKTVHDDEVRYFWEQEHQLLRGNTIGSLLTRLDTFIRHKVVRRVIAPRIDLQFSEIINRRSVLLVKLAQGLIGEENSTLLGTLFVSKLHQAALARQSITPDKRIPFFVYIDEFQNFITPSLAGVLSGTRKYGLGLILAHQDMRQIFEQDKGVANSVMSNPGTRICFRVGDFDAQKLQDGLGHFVAQDLLNLGLGEAICRVERSDDDFNLRIVPQNAVNPETVKARRKRIVELSHVEGGPIAADTKVDTEEPEVQASENLPMSVPSVEAPREPFISRPAPKPCIKLLATDMQPVNKEENPSEHRYLQTLIKLMAEQRGYRAVIEQPTPDGSGRVDVGLERDGEKIACEIAATTTDEHEFHNVQKCLSAGYDHVVVCTLDKKRLERIRALVSQKLDTASQARVHFFMREEVFAFLEKPSGKLAPKEERIKGYRVKVEYQDVGAAEGQNKRDAVAQVILQSIRRMRGR